jgi:hypothetical protein
MYKWGDITREAYRAERERLEAELGSLRTTTTQADVLVRAATLLKDLPAAWDAATADQRNALARLVFESIEIEDDRVTAVVPQSDFAPFFVKRAVDEGLLEANNNGATLVTPSTKVMNGRKRRVSVRRVHSASWRARDRYPPATSHCGPIKAGLLPFAPAAEVDRCTGGSDPGRSR